MSYGFKSAAECVEDHGMVAQVDATTATCEIEVSIDEVHDRFADDKINILQDNEYE